MKEGKYKNKYRIKSARRPHWNYADGGFYFVTICTKNQECFFGDVVKGEMTLNEIGRIAKNELLFTEKLRKNMELDEWIIMPNHVHAIIVINNDMAVETHCNASLRMIDITNGVNNRTGGKAPSVVETHCNASLRMIDITNGVNNRTGGKAPSVVETHCNASLREGNSYNNKFGPQRNNLSSIVRGIKSAIKQKCDKSGFPNFAWQARFYDRVIRNEKELQRIREYIYYNPDKWEEDRNNSENIFM